MKQIGKWGVFEIALNGKRDGNPYLDHEITGSLNGGHGTARVNGFYDGEGV